MRNPAGIFFGGNDNIFTLSTLLRTIQAIDDLLTYHSISMAKIDIVEGMRLKSLSHLSDWLVRGERL